MTSPTDATSSPPRWIAPWLALLAPLYVISPLALLGLPYLKRLPKTALWILGFYAVSQQIPALFTPEPLLASALALARTLLMFGLIGVGVALGDAQRLKPLAIGLGVVYVTAIVYSMYGGLDLLIGRLTHPYMTPITLGLAGAFGIWLSLFLKGQWLWRLTLGLGGLVILLLSGSRGSLAAALLGCVAGYVVNQGRRKAGVLVIGVGLLLAGFSLGERAGVAAISRLGTADTTGRDMVWSNTLSIVQAFPIGGVGTYRLGQYLAPPGNSCALFLDAQGHALGCPAWVANLGSPWLIAHNITFQQLAETGPLGLLGLFTLLGLALTGQLQKKNNLSLAILSGLLLATVNDNTLLVPSPFFAEVFWVVTGIQLMSIRDLNWSYGLIAGGMSLILSGPLLAGGVQVDETDQVYSIEFFHARKDISTPRNYKVHVQFKADPGDYRVILNACKSFCSTIASVPFKISVDNSPLLDISGDVFSTEKQRLELILLRDKSSLKLRPIGMKSWEVEMESERQ